MTSPIMLRRYLAEFVGTFAYVFFGCGTRILAGNAQDAASRLIVYFTFGFTLLALTYALSHLSGAPFNPAITLGLAVTKRFPWRYVLPYWISQVAGAIFASGQALSVVWIYWVGPLLGAILGSLLYEAMRGGEEHALEVPQGVFEGIRKTRAMTTQEANQLPETTRQSV